MRTFSELLTEYMARTGISDSELARTLGVSRQTIFRWKEGLVARPRVREDVLRCADRLRLTPQERDGLLLAAGFAPEDRTALRPTSVAPSPEAPMGVPQAGRTEIVATHAQVLTLPGVRRRRMGTMRRPAAAAAAILVFTTVAVLLFFVFRQATPSTFPDAVPGEILILIPPLSPSAAEPKQQTATPPAQGQSTEGRLASYDVAGGIRAAVEREIRAARLEQVRVEVWPEEIADARSAEGVRQHAHAWLVLWGSREGAIATVAFAARPAAARADDLPLDALVIAPLDEQLKIDATVGEQVQALAALVLAHLYVDRGDWSLARALLARSLSRPPSDPGSLASLYAHLGYVCQVSRPADLEQAAQFYAQAVGLTPEMATSYLNRGIAYVRMGKTAEWQADFARVLAIRQDSSDAQQGLCWGYVLDNQPGAALAHCDAAAAADTTGRSHFVRGIVLAESGRLADAAGELDAFLAWLTQQPESVRARYGAAPGEWAQALKAGRNPIDQTVLDKLRRE